MPSTTQDLERKIAWSMRTGTAFPSPANAGDFFYRTDLGELYVYNGTAWVPWRTRGYTIVVAASNSLDPTLADPTYRCVPPETLVFGNPDVKPISEFEVGERVLTHTGEFKPIVKRFTRPFWGNLISVKSFHGEEIKATPNHRVLAVRVKECPYVFREHCDAFDYCSRRDRVSPHTGRLRYGSPKCKNFIEGYKPEWVPLGELKEGDYIIFSFPTEIKDKKSIILSDYITEKKYIKKGTYLYSSRFNQSGAKQRNPTAKPVPNEIEITPEFMKLIGYYLAEGHTNEGQVRFSFNKFEKEYIEETKGLILKIFGLEPHIFTRDNVADVYVNSTLLANFFRGLFGRTAPKKTIPQWMLLLPVNKQKPLVEGLVNGDGCWDEKRTRFVTTSKQLAYSLRLILLRVGEVHSIRNVEPKDGGYINGRLIQARNVKWEFEWRNTRSKFAFIKNGYLWMRVRKKAEVPYNGLVYNLEVAEDNSYNVVGASLHNCDGTADQTEINAAITALGATGGAVILLDGTFAITASVTLASNVALVGQGAGTLLRVPNGHDADLHVIYANAKSNLLITNLQIDGNYANQTAGNMDGIYFYSVDKSMVVNNWIHGLNKPDWDFDWPNAADINLHISTNNIIAGNIVGWGKPGAVDLGAGILLAEGSDYNVVDGNVVDSGSLVGISLIDASNNTITGNTCQGNGDMGISLEGGPNDNYNNTISGNTCQGNSTGGINIVYSHNTAVTGNTCQGNSWAGITLTIASNSTITGNTCQGNNHDGIKISSSSNNTVEGNTIEGNSQGTHNTDDGIILDGESDYNNIQGNTIRQGVGANKQRYGIRINVATCDENLVITNDLYNAGTTANFSDAGTGTVVRDNRGWVTENNVLSPAFAIDAVAVVTVTIPHGLSVTPTAEDCQLTVVEDTDIDDWEEGFVKVESVGAANVVAKVNVTTASVTGGATAKLALHVDLAGG